MSSEFKTGGGRDVTAAEGGKGSHQALMVQVYRSAVLFRFVCLCGITDSSLVAELSGDM